MGIQHALKITPLVPTTATTEVGAVVSGELNWHALARPLRWAVQTGHFTEIPHEYSLACDETLSLFAVSLTRFLGCAAESGVTERSYPHRCYRKLTSQTNPFSPPHPTRHVASTLIQRPCLHLQVRLISVWRVVTEVTRCIYTNGSSRTCCVLPGAAVPA